MKKNKLKNNSFVRLQLVLIVFVLLIIFLNGCVSSDDETGNNKNEKPVITIVGDAVMHLQVGDVFEDPGATADDDVDGDISMNIVVGGDYVNTTNAGTYVITYNVSDNDGNQADQATRTVNVNTVDMSPNKPSNLEAITISSNRIDLFWNDNSDNEDGFMIERSLLDDFSTVIEFSVAPDTASLNDIGLQPSTEYFYRVMAYNANGDSEYSNFISSTTTEQTEQFIADHTIAKEEVLRQVPEEYINYARENFHIAYQHTSHGTHVSRGMFGLQDYKTNDDNLFSITDDGNPEPGKLDFHDYAIASYHAPGEDAADLSRNETAFIQATRNFLDDPDNADVNVIMWSWCNIAGHDVVGNYLPGMETLISEYGTGGSKPRAATTPVTFIFMTGHANGGANTGTGHPKSQADEIIDYCNTNQQFCLDYYGIDSHDMDDNYYEDVDDNGNSNTYGGNFYLDFQNSHTLGVDWFENKRTPGGAVDYGAHNTQHITANRKAYAMWWILARLAGWDG